MTKDNQEIINEMNKKIIDLIESYSDNIPAYEIGFALINHAVSVILYCAPNDLVGIKTILASVENGISQYEENHS